MSTLPLEFPWFAFGRALLALIAGGLIGYAFGLVQAAARRQNEIKEAGGKLKSIWLLMPGSGIRVAYFLVALVLVQLVCPLLFADGTQWWVSGGIVLGYGWLLFAELRQRVVSDRALHPVGQGISGSPAK